MDELIDPRLGDRFVESEVICMLHAASLCIRRDPHLRPRMSQVKSQVTNHYSVQNVSNTKNCLVDNEGVAYTGRRYDSGWELRINSRFRRRQQKWAVLGGTLQRSDNERWVWVG